MRNSQFPILVERDGMSHVFDLNQARTEEELLALNLELSNLWSAGARLKCQCSGNGTRLLRIDSRGRLSREPGRGFEHAPTCLFHFPPVARSGMAGYQVENQLEDAPGEWRLEVGPVIGSPLEVFESASDTPDSLHSLRALLDFLWLVAGLNHWSPASQASRNVRDVHEQLQKAAQDIYLDKYPLSDVLLVGTPGVKEQKKSNLAKARRASEKHQPFLALVPLSAWSDVREQATDGMLPLTDFDGIPAFACPASLWRKELSETPFVSEAWQSGEKVLAMILATHQSPRLANVKKLILMPVSCAWIPLRSRFDHNMECALRAEDRCFWKPLEFDGMASTHLPDFWLEEGGSRPIPVILHR